MPRHPAEPDAFFHSHAKFPDETPWTVILGAGAYAPDDRQSVTAELYRLYAAPLYAWLRKDGKSPSDAQDLVQGCFANLLEHDALAPLSPVRGRLRDFLRRCLKNWLLKQMDRDSAQRRKPTGGFVELGAAELEAQCEPALLEAQTPDAACDQQWVESIYAEAYRRLQDEVRSAGKEVQFEILWPLLPGRLTPDEARDAATRLNTSLNNLSQMRRRLHRRYGEILRAEVRRTLVTDLEYREELRIFFPAWQEKPPPARRKH